MLSTKKYLPLLFLLLVVLIVIYFFIPSKKVKEGLPKYGNLPFKIIKK
jgi:hypothetical protein